MVEYAVTTTMLVEVTSTVSAGTFSLEDDNNAGAEEESADAFGSISAGMIVVGET